VGKTTVIYVKFLHDVRAKNYLNRPLFHGVIQKITLAPFFDTRCIHPISTPIVMWLSISDQYSNLGPIISTHLTPFQMHCGFSAL